MKTRPRRLRSGLGIRELTRDVYLRPEDMIYPIFIQDGGEKEEISSMPGQYRIPWQELPKLLEKVVESKISGVCLFPKINDDLKDSEASYALRDECFYYQAIRECKKNFPGLLVMTDIAYDPYSSDGHDGKLNPETGVIDNDESVKTLVEMALRQVDAGADILGPSDMMDGRVLRIREALNKIQDEKSLIMSYTAKYCSHFYGPFREALDSAPRGGDKKSYQMDFRRKEEAIWESYLDEKEGADILMVKPGIAYLDILAKMRESTQLPLAVYQVSGEYAMIKAAGEKGWINAEEVALESLYAFKRAGAQIILSYFALELAPRLS